MGPIIIGHVGRFTYQKNHEFLLRVFREVHEKNPQTRLLLIGVGPERERIEALICDWHLEDVIRILEKRSDVNRLMQAMDCFALPSRFEGLPIVLIEAQAVGCKCLTSDKVTEEAFLTEGIVRLLLLEDWWVDMILSLAKTKIPRSVKNADTIYDHGYDIREQIKKVEKEYLRGIEKCSDAG